MIYVQTLRVVCIFEMVCALLALLWMVVAMRSHLPGVESHTQRGIWATMAALTLLVVSALFTEIGRFILAAEVTWRLPVNVAAGAAVLAAVVLFARSGWSLPLRPEAAQYRRDPLVSVVAVMFLLVTSTVMLIAFQQNDVAGKAKVIARQATANAQKIDEFNAGQQANLAAHERTQAILCAYIRQQKVAVPAECGK